MKAVGLYLVIKKSKGKVRTHRSGLEMPTDMEDRFVEATVTSVSDLGVSEFGINEGDTVLYDKHAGRNSFKNDEGEFFVITCRDVAVVL